jgi:hypothetical protein
MSVAPLPQTRDKGLERKEVPHDATLPHVTGRGWRCPESAAPPRNLLHRDVVVHSQKPPRLGEGWSSNRWGRRGPGPSGTHCHPEMRELAWYGGTLLIDLLSQPASAEGISCALVVGARYVEWIGACAKLGLEVARWSLLT